MMQMGHRHAHIFYGWSGGSNVGNLAKVNIKCYHLWKHIFNMKKENLEDEVMTFILRNLSKYQIVYLAKQMQFFYLQLTETLLTCA